MSEVVRPGSLAGPGRDKNWAPQNWARRNPGRRASETRQQRAAIAAATSSTDGQAPISSPRPCDAANANRPAAVSWAAVRRPSRRSQIAMQVSPQPASTTPPSGREPVATATPKPPIRPAAAIGAVAICIIARLSMRRASGAPMSEADEGSPPLALARLLGSVGPIESVEHLEILVGEREVEHLAVLLDPLAVGGLGDHHRFALQGPADQDLRRRALEPLRDLGNGRVVQMAASPQGAVGLERDIALPAGRQQTPAVFERAELHLVDHGRRMGRRDHLIELRHAEVRDADRAGEAALAGSLHPRPGPGRAPLRPVHDVQVDVLDPQPLQAALNLCLRVLAGWIELGRQE